MGLLDTLVPDTPLLTGRGDGGLWGGLQERVCPLHVLLW